jgi:hypothetical protein
VGFDGSDRPLIYATSESKDGLYFNADQPQFSFAFVKQGQSYGQFRDVKWWVPKTKVENPTTRPIPQN